MITVLKKKNVELFEASDKVAYLEIQRPESLNALNQELLVELKEVLTQVSQEKKFKFLLLAGAGEKSFVAGADISEMSSMNPQEAVEFSKLGHDVCGLLEQMSCPTLALVHGFALGGGTEISLACDFIYASEKAKFGQPEVKLGLIPGFGGTFRLSRRVGIAHAKELIFSGKVIDSHEALRIGLVNQVFSNKEELLENGLKIAKETTENAMSAIRESKRLINELYDQDGFISKVDQEAIAFGTLFGSPDQIEGTEAFVQKRKPKFIS